MVLFTSSGHALQRMVLLVTPIAVLAAEKQTIQQPQKQSNQLLQNNSNSRAGKSKKITLALAAVTGLHHFYLENYTAGVIYVVLIFTGIGVALTWLDFFYFLSMDDQEWNEYLASDRGPPWRE